MACVCVCVCDCVCVCACVTVCACGGSKKQGKGCGGLGCLCSGSWGMGCEKQGCHPCMVNACMVCAVSLPSLPPILGNPRLACTHVHTYTRTHLPPASPPQLSSPTPAPPSPSHSPAVGHSHCSHRPQHAPLRGSQGQQLRVGAAAGRQPQSRGVLWMTMVTTIGACCAGGGRRPGRCGAPWAAGRGRLRLPQPCRQSELRMSK